MGYGVSNLLVMEIALLTEANYQTKNGSKAFTKRHTKLCFALVVTATVVLTIVK